MASDQFSLHWDNFHNNMSTGMNSLLEGEDLVDVTLAVEGKYLKAHKLVLSVCSPYFKELFKTNPCKHPIVFMKDVSYVALSDLLQFMYQGEVQVSQDNLTAFIKTAEALQIKGLTGDNNGSSDNDVDAEKPRTVAEPPVPQPIVQDYKPTPKVRKIMTAPVTVPPPAKRQRPSTDIQMPLAKPEPPSNSSSTSNDQIVQFKMEPYEQSSTISISDDIPDETFGDDAALDDTAVDDTEDYSMMEGAEEEPQAGTSTEGAGEGQEYVTDLKDVTMKLIKRKQNMPRYIVDGFVFHVNIMKGKPPMIYLRCLEYKRLGCHARAVIPYDGSIQDIKVNKAHNHPPDFAAEEKIVFMRELKEVMLKHPNVPSRTVYSTLSEMYPNAARETPFDTIRHKMNRWRRIKDE